MMTPTTDLSLWPTDFDAEQKYRASKVLDWLYWNANGFACVVVAIAGDAGNDWAAYINGTFSGISERHAVVWVAARGCKLDEEVARAIFEPRGRVSAELVWRS